MKKFFSDFIRRGLTSCGFGPTILAIIYFVLKQTSNIESLTVNQVCIGIFSLTFLAFIAGGINSIYQIEQLPLMFAVMIHGVVLYISYLAAYLINDWLELNYIMILVFSAFFIVGFFIIWLIIYSAIKRKTEKINKVLFKKQYNADEK